MNEPTYDTSDMTMTFHYGPIELPVPPPPPPSNLLLELLNKGAAKVEPDPHKLFWESFNAAIVNIQMMPKQQINPGYLVNHNNHHWIVAVGVILMWHYDFASIGTITKEELNAITKMVPIFNAIFSRLAQVDTKKATVYSALLNRLKGGAF